MSNGPRKLATTNTGYFHWFCWLDQLLDRCSLLLTVPKWVFP